jgi:hypothetical protein
VNLIVDRYSDQYEVGENPRIPLRALKEDQRHARGLELRGGGMRLSADAQAGVDQAAIEGRQDAREIGGRAVRNASREAQVIVYEQHPNRPTGNSLRNAGGRSLVDGGGPCPVVCGIQVSRLSAPGRRDP